MRVIKMGAGRTGFCPRFYVEVYDHKRKRHRLAGFADQRATAAMGRTIETLVDRQTTGLEIGGQLLDDVLKLPDRVIQHLRSRGLVVPSGGRDGPQLTGLLSAYVETQRDRELSPRHISDSAHAIRLILDAMPGGVLAAEPLQHYLAERRRNDKRFGITTSNHYLKHAKAFANWLCREGQLERNPIAYLRPLNAATDVRLVRRALDNAELTRLLDITSRESTRWGMAGVERRLLYWLVVETGLRSSEVRSLTPSSLSEFCLKSNSLKQGSVSWTEPPTLTVQAAHSKRRRLDVLPLRRELAEALGEHCRLAVGGALFTMPVRANVAAMLRDDLEAARIPYRDDAGAVLDFHALRHTFITNLVRAGVHPRIVQQLARHSTMELTMNVYTHLEIRDAAAALERLRMCDDCRVIVQFEAGDAPFKGPDRPLTRTTDDDLREREIEEARAKLLAERGAGGDDGKGSRNGNGTGE